MRFSYLLLLAVGVFAQPQPGSITAGFKIGAPVNELTSQRAFNSTGQQSRWTGGPTVERALPFRFAEFWFTKSLLQNPHPPVENKIDQFLIRPSVR
jgi:hypothetical protein